MKLLGRAAVLSSHVTNWKEIATVIWSVKAKILLGRLPLSTKAEFVKDNLGQCNHAENLTISVFSNFCKVTKELKSFCLESF